jgi:hypothetical protein
MELATLGAALAGGLEGAFSGDIWQAPRSLNQQRVRIPNRRLGGLPRADGFAFRGSA